jgi:hypothetical protein
MAQRLAGNRLLVYSNFLLLRSTINVTAHPGGSGFVSATGALCTFCDLKVRSSVYKGDAGG